MICKNAIGYRLPAPWAMTAEKLEEQLARARFVPLGRSEIQTSGWDERNGELVTSIAGRFILRLKTERKLLPSKVIKKKAAELAVAYEEANGYPPGRKARRELEERALQELLPNAQSVDETTTAWIDPKLGFLFVNASSPAKGDVVVEALRRSLDEFPLKPIHTEVSPASFMTDALASGEVPGFSIDRECELKSIGEDKACVRYSRHPLLDEVHAEIKAHLAAGKVPTRLAMTYDDRVAFVLTEKMIVKSIMLLDIAKDSAEEAEAKEEQYEIDFTLFSGEFIRAFQALIQRMGGEVSEDGKVN